MEFHEHNVPNEQVQIARDLFVKQISAMKELLTMGEFKFGGKDNDGYKFYKRNVMDQCFIPMIDLFKELEDRGLIVRCECDADINKRNGYKVCQNCHGASYKNSPDFDAFLNGKPVRDPHFDVTD